MVGVCKETNVLTFCTFADTAYASHFVQRRTIKVGTNVAAEV